MCMRCPRSKALSNSSSARCWLLLADMLIENREELNHHIDKRLQTSQKKLNGFSMQWAGPFKGDLSYTNDIFPSMNKSEIQLVNSQT